MATWTVRAKYKKSTLEREFFVKDNQVIAVETGWRSGSFNVTTETDSIPEYDVVNVNGIDVYGDYPDGVEEVVLNETFDGCWCDIEYVTEMPEEEKTRLEALMEEDSHFTVLENEGWAHSDTEMDLVGPLIIEDSEGNVVADGNPDKE